MTHSYAIGVDLGGTTLRVGIVDHLGSVTEKKVSDVQGGAVAIKEQIAFHVRELIKNKNQDPIAIGIGLAGQIDATTGNVIFAPNLQWKNVSIQHALQQDLGLPVLVTNDVRAATWGEWQFGAGKGCQDLVCIFVGTGIGGGIVSQGQVMSGATNSAGEIGHMIIEMGGNACACGQQGCLEAYASGWAIAKLAKESIQKDPQQGKTIFELAGGKLEQVSSREVAIAYKSADPLATTIINGAIRALIAGTTNIVNLFNPKMVLFGGGVVKGMPELIEPVRKGVMCSALASATKNLEIHSGNLGDDAGIIGAAIYAMNQKMSE